RRASPSRRISGTISSHAAPALPQLVADDSARSARHIVEDAALDKRVYARVAEQDQQGGSGDAGRTTMSRIRSPTDRRPGFLNSAPTFDVRDLTVIVQVFGCRLQRASHM